MKNDNKRLIAKIAPATKLPQGVTQVFSYAVQDKFEKKIKTGMLVEIFFRNRKIIGVVCELKKEDLKNFKYKLQPINGLLDNSIALSKEQIKLAEYISAYYYTPLSLVMKTIVPAITKNKPRKKIELSRLSELSSVSALKLKNLKLENKILFIHNLQAERHDLYSRIIKKNIKGKNQVLVLLPEYFDIYNFSNFYKNKFGEDKIAILTSELTKNQYFNEWQKIKNGSIKIIIGTRQAVFAPFQNLKLIIVDDEHSSSYKQWDMNPRYHGVTVAEKLTKIWKAKIILSSPSPSVKNYYDAQNKYSDRFKPLPNNLNFHLVDLNTEHQKGNYSVLSEDLQKSLLENIYQRKQAIIFIPRLGNNTITQCRDCHWIAQCKNCETTLISYGNYLYCQKCQEKVGLIKKCSKCAGQNISSFGYGSEKIERAIKKLFANKNIKINRLDSDTASNKSKRIKIYQDFIDKKIDVLIGTQMVLKNWNLENLALTAILFPEIIFNQPEFNSREKSFQFLMFLYNKVSKNHQVIIQSHKPDNNLFKIIKNGNLHKFYLAEIKNRKAILKNKIGYPPFAQLIKLIYKDFNSQNCQAEAERMFRILDSKIKNDKNLKNKFEIVKPFPASSYKEFGKYRWHIIIKSTCKDIKLRNLVLNLVKKNWIIDIDPERIL
ncbi:MAG: primosomal protein N' [Patescibacteria group bacterium]|nr:primosomal protein N' [Patescibacteria group bacterium]